MNYKSFMRFFNLLNKLFFKQLFFMKLEKKLIKNVWLVHTTKTAIDSVAWFNLFLAQLTNLVESSPAFSNLAQESVFFFTQIHMLVLNAP